MTQEQKDLLLKDLCARLPYGVKISVQSWDEREMEYTDRVDVLYSVNGDEYIKSANEDYDFSLEDIKPYLFPMSSMTKEQMEELEKLCDMYIPEDDYNPYIYKGIAVLYKHLLDDGYEVNIKTDIIDFFHKNHIDYRGGGLIPLGLAKDATNLNIY